MFQFKPKEGVRIKVLDTVGRVNRCIIDAGGCVIYSVRFVMNGDCREIEFYEDEVEPVNSRIDRICGVAHDSNTA